MTSKSNYIMPKTIIDFGTLRGIFHTEDFEKLSPPSDEQMRHIDDKLSYIRKDDLDGAKIVPPRDIGDQMTVATKKYRGLGIFSIALICYGQNPINGKVCVQRRTLNYDPKMIHDLDYANTFFYRGEYHSNYIATHIGSMGAIVRTQTHIEDYDVTFDVDPKTGEMKLLENSIFRANPKTGKIERVAKAAPNEIQRWKENALSWADKAYAFSRPAAQATL